MSKRNYEVVVLVDRVSIEVRAKSKKQARKKVAKRLMEDFMRVSLKDK